MPINGQKPVTNNNRNLTPQKQAPQPIQRKVQNQVGFHTDQNHLPSRNISEAAVTEYKDLNDKKNNFAIHGFYVLLLILVGTASYLYAMKIKPPRVEVVEKVIEKTIERVEYTPPAVAATASRANIEVDTNIPRVELAPRKHYFEDELKQQRVQRKYDKLYVEHYAKQREALDAYNAMNRGNSYDWGYKQLKHKFKDEQNDIREKEYHEVCAVTGSHHHCDRAAKFSTALKNDRALASDY